MGLSAVTKMGRCVPHELHRVATANLLGPVIRTGFPVTFFFSLDE